MPKKGRQPGRYGFVETESPISQLRAVLGMQHWSQQSRFEAIKGEHKRLAFSYMDVQEKSYTQGGTLEIIEHKLLNIYPEIYSGDVRNKRLYFSRRLAMYYHNQRRSQLKYNAKKLLTHVLDQQPGSSATKHDTLPIPSPSHSIYTDTSNSLLDVPGVKDSGSLKPETAPEDNSSTSQKSEIKSEEPSLACVRTRYVLRDIGDDSKSTLMSSNSVVPKKESDDEDLEISQRPRSSGRIRKEGYSTLPKSRGEEYAFIYEFLMACQPSMEQLLSKFLENGCDSEAKLRILSGWSSVDRKNWLRNISEGPEMVGRAIKGMDIDILDNYIETYFV